MVDVLNFSTRQRIRILTIIQMSSWRVQLPTILKAALMTKVVLTEWALPVVWEENPRVSGKFATSKRDSLMEKTNYWFSLFSQEEDQPMVRQRFKLELTVWKTSSLCSLIQNADSVTTTTLWQQTGSNVRWSHQLSTSWNTKLIGTLLASFAKTLQLTLSPRLLLSVFHLLDTSKMYTPHFHIDTMSKLLLRLSTHDMDQRMVTPLFRSGVRTS